MTRIQLMMLFCQTDTVWDEESRDDEQIFGKHENDNKHDGDVNPEKSTLPMRTYMPQCNLIILVHFPHKTSQNCSKVRGEVLFIFYTFSKYSARMH